MRELYSTRERSYLHTPRLDQSTASLIPACAFAVFADEAYQTDYHHALLGIPREASTFVHQPVAASKASLIYTLTEKGLVAAVNPKDGSILWRQQLPGANSTSQAVLKAGRENVVASASTSQVASWQASDGRLIWSHDYGHDVAVKDVQFLQFNEDGSTTGAQDLVVLYESSTAVVVERRDAPNTAYTAVTTTPHRATKILPS